MAFAVVSAAVPVLRRKVIGADSIGFRVPFGPFLIPGLSIMSCAYIVRDLSARAHMVFFICMGIAVISYFAYGIHNSRLNQAVAKL
jgi:APA family basic amino acid/polyamine antiporter